MAQSYGERERKDSDLIEEIRVTAEMAAEKVPEKVLISHKDGYDIIQLKTSEPGVHERKEHHLMAMFEPEP